MNTHIIPLQASGVDVDEESLEDNGIAHCQFAAHEGMEASIPIKKAVSRSGDVILAFEMNGQSVPASHGYPLRAVVPGHVGVRNVKWLKSITLSAEEARGPWQRSMAYKGACISIHACHVLIICYSSSNLPYHHAFL